MAEKKIIIKKTKAGPKSKVALEKPATKVEKKPVVRSKHGKKYQAAVAKIAKNQQYALTEAVGLVKETTTTSFVSSVELHIQLRQEARSSVQMPHSTGKKTIVAVATDETIEQIAKGIIDFDVLIAEPTQMGKLAKHAKLLGPKGLMPNPKSGTVTDDIAKVKQELESGKTELRTDAGKNVHLVVGTVKTDSKEVEENCQAVMHALETYGVKAVTLSSTMGPGIKVALEEKERLDR